MLAEGALTGVDAAAGVGGAGLAAAPTLESEELALAAGESEVAGDWLDSEPATAPAAGAFAASPPRKSVTYQPEPLSWKPAAVTCF